MVGINAFKTIGSFLAGAILTAAGAWFFLPPSAPSVEQQKMFVSYVLQNSSEWRKTNTSGKTSLGVDTKQEVFSTIEAAFSPDFLLASPENELIAYKQDIGVLLIVRAVISDGVLTWRCFGFPVAAIPASCK